LDRIAVLIQSFEITKYPHDLVASNPERIAARCLLGGVRCLLGGLMKHDAMVTAGPVKGAWLSDAHGNDLPLF